MTDADHIIPWFEGGTDDLDNLQAACPPCHQAKTQAEATRGRARHSRLRPPVAHPADRWR
ncbi:HNH endonuclease signature motif containing protein [Dietzia maris]|uniref:HNH endonuclease signature motif containing protein n=1 Tax=Dietzia maris TaxID=37915 RepID=A0AAE4QXN7_9ACTN|nr:HNH endonuclease signature motif containing protein [Dietzia maris]MDV6299965.1 HNH endonuclease signature motif containing protein [Dietzia maris]